MKFNSTLEFNTICDVSKHIIPIQTNSDNQAKRSRVSEASLSSISIEMPPHIIEKQKSAINGYLNYDAKVFIQQARQGWHLIVLGLYPISNDCEGENIDAAIFSQLTC